MSTTPQSPQNNTDQEPDTSIRDAIWFRNESFYSKHSGAEIVSLTMNLSWENYDFTKQLESQRSPNATPLETANNTTLAVLAPDGNVYQLGDIVRFETTPSKRGWGRKKSDKTVIRENQIDYLGSRTLSISRLPTYSNTPSNSPSADYTKTDIELLSRSDLADYRVRYNKSKQARVPENVNGWELTNKSHYGTGSSVLPTGIIKEMQWSNGESTTVTAKWRSSYHCWWLSTPIESVICDKNEDKYLYEIDVPHQVVRLETIIDLATQVMQTLEPDAFQDGYDLRDPNEIDHSTSQQIFTPPTTIPEKIGEWELTERRRRELIWESTNPQSVWEGFEVKIDPHGGVRVKNTNKMEIHDTQYIKRHLPNGDLHPKSSNPDGYQQRRRDLFDDHWHIGFAFMSQSSKEAVNQETLSKLNDEFVGDGKIETFNHGISMDAMETMDRTNETLLAYSGSA